MSEKSYNMNKSEYQMDADKKWIRENVEAIPFDWSTKDNIVTVHIDGTDKYIDGYVKIEHLRQILADDLRSLGFKDSIIFDTDEPLLFIDIIHVDYSEIKVHIGYFESEIEDDYIDPEYIGTRIKKLISKVFTVHDDIKEVLNEYTANEYMIKIKQYYDEVYHGNRNDPNDYSECAGLNFDIIVKNPLYVDRPHILKLYDEYEQAVIDDFGKNDEFSISVIDFGHELRRKWNM